MEWQNKLTQLLGVTYPVIQAPMLGVTSPAMVAAISNAGGLGSLPVGGFSPEKTRQLIQEVKSLTDKPYSVNLFAHDVPDIDSVQAEAMRSYLNTLIDKNGLHAEVPDLESLKFYTYKEQIAILTEENVPIVSFTFGIPDDGSLTKMKQHGIILIGTATCTEEAILLAEKNVDAIVLQGIEAGGHRGSFIPGDVPQVGLMALVPMARKAVNIPLIASGSINSGETVKAAFALGALAVQIGTAFISANESLAIPAYKQALATAKDTDTILTRAFSGRWARGIKNDFIDKVESTGLDIPPYPIQNSLTGTLRAEAQKKDNGQLTNLWSGQAAALSADKLPSADIFNKIISETESL
ncbi:NAD(P)H-dependent flavin oxidoreductase [Flavobacterium psychrotrophum]|uniref:NAD(P)H-dependent flavin oxidoreductase n=1 Tax=Flavobacterium psychrotrophum TaxID=2294119 RepID=UPI000E318D29|nr:nitronate monooxygenase family protein [Flavobacterium psychrotrophum]